MNAAYYLAPHVHACRVRNHVVLLDLKRDRYLGITGAEADSLQDRVHGLPCALASKERTGSACATDGAKADASVLEEMLALGMLVHGHDVDGETECESIERPARSLVEAYCDTPPTIGPREIVRFTVAVLTARRLTRAPLEKLVAHARRTRAAVGRLDLEEARRHMTVFSRLRAFMYSDRDACLFSSVAAREYFCRCDIVSRLVFGVATNPFRAHCWLQHGDLVLNDVPDRVRAYVPILVA